MHEEFVKLMHEETLEDVEPLEESNAWAEVPRHDEFVEVNKLTC